MTDGPNHNLSDYGFSNRNLYCRLTDWGKANPGAPLLETSNGVRYQYRDAEARSSQIASVLVGLGAKAGDRVTVQVGKSPEALWLYLACLKAGFVYHPLNPAYQEEELRFFLQDAGPHVVVCDPRNEPSLRALADEVGVPHLVTLGTNGTGSLIGELADADTDFPCVHRDSDDLAALLYSSGTTGRPKGIMLTHNNLEDNALALARLWGFSAEDRLLHALPIFHVHGLFFAVGCVMMTGACMRWLPKFDAQEVLRFLPECTAMMGVPTYYTRLLANPDFGTEICANMRLFISGSAPLLEATFDEFQERSGHTILERYGMTETGVNCSNPLVGKRKAGTVGPPLPGVSARIVDEAGNVTSGAETGDLQVKGAHVFAGYWNLPEKTAEDFTEDGFFRTGDQGRIDADGYVSIVGRAKDMIISGGLNIYPKEIELVLDKYEGVVESAVIGVPHGDFGEAVVAVIVAKDSEPLTEEDVIDAVRSKLAAFKVPKKVFFIDELPLNTMGKVQKKVLRERFETCCTSA